MEEQSRNRWHNILAALLMQVWPEVGIEVLTDIKVLQEPPEVDFVLLRRHTPAWTSEQRARLPDGVRDSTASHILIEFKYTESLNDKAVCSALGYDHFYRLHRGLKPTEVQTFLMISKTPRKSTLATFKYQPTDKNGVYRSDNDFLTEIPPLLLNELADEQHNAFVKLFASRKKEKIDAFELLDPFLDEDQGYVSTLLHGLIDLWFEDMGDQEMTLMTLKPPTVEQILALGEEHMKLLVGITPKKYFLERLSLEDRAENLSDDEIEQLMKILAKKRHDASSK